MTKKQEGAGIWTYGGERCVMGLLSKGVEGQSQSQECHEFCTRKFSVQATGIVIIPQRMKQYRAVSYRRTPSLLISVPLSLFSRRPRTSLDSKAQYINQGLIRLVTIRCIGTLFLDRSRSRGEVDHLSRLP